MDVPPVYQPAPPPPPPRSGCFAKGCLLLLVAFFALLIVVLVGGWFACSYAIRTFTAAQSGTVQTEHASPQEMQTAEAKMDTLRAAIRNRRETTIEFTAADLNALIANDPAFNDTRGHAHFAIANSTISLDLSAPLVSVPWKVLKSRWWNGRVQFGLSYIDDEFSIDVKSAEANGHTVPHWVFGTGFSHSFNRSFNESFHHESHGHPDDLWRHLKMMSVQDDKLIITTRGT
jgi:hypothetical protein